MSLTWQYDIFMKAVPKKLKFSVEDDVMNLNSISDFPPIVHHPYSSLFVSHSSKPFESRSENLWIVFLDRVDIKRIGFK
ncbi:hypothetical protein L1987_49432 [Smallanthus sonchifolius]|uniref:Uncharacterized protein n=1 Tax=Smallanthus sonchifolius TaxID=185202 RepID=A0ACB9FUH9_9ASTR|nr:hypothetical protein L1987_49432 [Smallanthus sonchifolius]